MANSERQTDELLCKYCKNKCNSGPKCEKCGSIFHPSCAKRIKKLKSINVNTVICCDEELPNTPYDELDINSALSNGGEQSPEICLLKYIIVEKDVIIKNLRDQIEMLKQNNNLLKVQNAHALNKLQPDGYSSAIRKNNNSINVNIGNSSADNSTDNSTIHDKNSNNYFSSYATSASASNQQLEDPNTKAPNDQIKANLRNTYVRKEISQKEVADGIKAAQIHQKLRVFTDIGNGANEEKTIQGNEYIKVIHKKNRKPRNKAIIGTADTDSNEEDAFVGRLRPSSKVWLFISRARDHVNVETVKKYITKKLLDEDVSVRLIKTRRETSDNQCFLIGVDWKHKDTVYTASFWPSGIAHARFNFRRGQHFLDINQTAIPTA